MKKLVIFINGNFVSAVFKEPLELDSVLSDLTNGTGLDISFDSDKGAHVFIKRAKIDGYYVTDYEDPKPNEHTEISKKYLKFLDKMMEGGEEWKGGQT